MSLPLHLCQVLEEEYVALYGELPETPVWLLAPEHITRPEQLAAKLRGEDALARHLRGHGLAAVLDLEGDGLRAGLVAGLNAALTSGALYDRGRFAHVTLSADLRRLTTLDVEGEDLVQVNRLLLEAAFADEITPIHEARTAAVHLAIHRRAKRPENPAPRTALCFSGGGIRSATFGLGVVQALAHLRLLDKFDYLSTVSGGGYLGSWLSAWVHRHREGLDGVMASVTAPAPKPPLRPEPAPVRHLREYSNYLSPKLGALSADTWTLVATYVRNLVLNWLVLVPIFLAALAVSRVGVSVLEAPPSVDGVEGLLQWLGFACLIFAVVYMGVSRPSAAEQRNRRPLAHLTGQVSFLVACLTPLVLSAMLLTAWWTWVAMPVSLPWFATTGGVLHLIAWTIYALWMRRLRGWDEALVAILTGVVAGVLVWCAAYLVSVYIPFDYLPQFLVCFAVPLFLTAFLLATTLFVGLVSLLTDDDDREWLARFGGWVLIVIVGWAVLGTIVIFGPLALGWLGAWSQASVGAAAIASGVASALLGRSPSTPARDGGGGGGLTAALLKHAPMIVALVTLLLLVVGLSILTNPLMHWLSETMGGLEMFERFVQPMPESVFAHHAVVAQSTVTVGVVFLVSMVAIGLGMSMLINVNKFSLHAMYRNRLIRAYLGASRAGRRPNPFTGFDPGDNIQMSELRRGLLHMDGLDDVAGFVATLAAGGDAPSKALLEQLPPATRTSIRTHRGPGAPAPTLQRRLVADLNRLLLDGWFAGQRAFTERAAPATTAALAAAPLGDAAIRVNRMLLHDAYPDVIAPPPPERHGLLHVVNIALNLVSGHNLAWQERKAETFTVSPLHAGSYHLGYRSSRTYGGRIEGISLGTAITISGAAASPNMGYHSSPLLALVMMFFNVRLGWWLGNPGVHGQRTYEQAFPKPSIKPMLAEAFGLTDDTSRHVYLSDGGHFENLGLLEMIVRRCHFIVLSDAGADPDCDFTDLANAMRKVRIDLGVPITVRGEMRIVSRTRARGEPPSRYCAIADIDYAAVDGPDAAKGILLYVKPCFYGGEPTDIFNYASAHATFPHESTADQFFSESQFESYRMLGFHTMQSIWQADWGPIAPYLLAELQTRAETYLKSARD
jgi:patatin-like phospholipase